MSITCVYYAKTPTQPALDIDLLSSDRNLALNSRIMPCTRHRLLHDLSRCYRRFPSCIKSSVPIRLGSIKRGDWRLNKLTCRKSTRCGLPSKPSVASRFHGQLFPFLEEGERKPGMRLGGWLPSISTSATNQQRLEPQVSPSIQLLHTPLGRISKLFLPRIVATSSHFFQAHYTNPSALSHLHFSRKVSKEAENSKS